MHFFEMNLHDHLAAAVSNLLKDDQQGRFLERAVYYNELTTVSVDKIEHDAQKIGEKILHDQNSKALQLQETDDSSAEATERFRFGLFFYREDERAKGESS